MKRNKHFVIFFPLFLSFPFLFYPILKLWKQENKQLANALAMDLIPDINQLVMAERMVSLG